MKKSRIILIVLAVVIAIIAAIVWWQFGNIKAVYYWWKYSETDIEEMVEKNDDALNEFIKSNPEYNVHPTTPLEEKLYQEGIINEDELGDMLTEKITVEDMFGKQLELSPDNKLIDSDTGEEVTSDKAVQMKSESKKENSSQSSKAPQSNQSPDFESGTGTTNETNTSKTGKESSSNTNIPNLGSGNGTAGSASEEVSSCIAQVYVLRSSFVGQLDALYSQAVASYEALPNGQKESGKQAIISSLYPQAVSLEASCDSQMEQILSRLQSLLSSSGGDTSLVGRIRSAYQSEKSLKKAYYLNQI